MSDETRIGRQKHRLHSKPGHFAFNRNNIGYQHGKFNTGLLISPFPTLCHVQAEPKREFVHKSFLDSVKFNKQNSIKIMYLNARSLLNKTEEIQHIIKKINQNNNRTIQLIAITETWINYFNSTYFTFGIMTPYSA